MSEPRPLSVAVPRGMAGKCPACGQARLFRRFLKPVEQCPHCHQDFRPQQADDFPAYIVILLLGHILVPIVIEVNLTFNWPIGVQMLVWPALTALLALAMIQPAKGAVIAYQWAHRLHGFH